MCKFVKPYNFLSISAINYYHFIVNASEEAEQGGHEGHFALNFHNYSIGLQCVSGFLKSLSCRYVYNYACVCVCVCVCVHPQGYK